MTQFACVVVPRFCHTRQTVYFHSPALSTHTSTNSTPPYHRERTKQNTPTPHAVTMISTITGRLVHPRILSFPSRSARRYKTSVAILHQGIAVGIITKRLLAFPSKFFYQTHVTVISISRARGTCSKLSLTYGALQQVTLNPMRS